MSEEKQVVPAAAGEVDGDAKTKKQAEAEIIKEFQKLKEEKNNISTKMAEIKMDMNEHEYDEPPLICCVLRLFAQDVREDNVEVWC